MLPCTHAVCCCGAAHTYATESQQQRKVPLRCGDQTTSVSDNKIAFLWGLVLLTTTQECLSLYKYFASVPQQGQQKFRKQASVRWLLLQLSISQ